jgi:hypothetical protein
MHARPSASQDQQAAQSDDITRRDLARFDQFLDSHREVADQLRKTPALVDDPQYLQGHPELNTYLQDHPNVKQAISQHPDTFMSLEDRYSRDRALRDRDAGGQPGDGNRRNDADRGNGANGGNDANRGNEANRAEDANIQEHDHGELVIFGQFLDQHREIAEQVRKDPSLIDHQDFVQNHPALQTFLQDHPGIRQQATQDPNAFMHEEDAVMHDSNTGNHDPMHDHMMDFGGFLRSHSDIRNDLSNNPSKVKDNDYVRNHTELVAYLNTHADVRAELMANPQNFVHGALQYGSSSGAGVNGSGRGTTGSTGTTGTTGTSTGPGTSTTHEPTKPNQ